MRVSIIADIITQLGSDPSIHFGHTGEIVETIGRGKYKKFRVKLDGGEETFDLFEDEIYFPDHEDGYNQPSCQ